jgi:hypothetical protein
METLLTLCNRAQEQLPEQRRRFLTQIKQVPKLVETIRQRLLVIKENAERWEDYTKQKEELGAIAEPNTPSPTPNTTPNNDDALAVFSDEALTYYLLNERQIPLTLLLPGLVERVSLLLEGQKTNQNQLPKLFSLVEEQEEKLDMLLDHLTRSNKPASPPVQPNGGTQSLEKKKLPRFAICGLWQNKFYELQRACKNHAELRYLDRDMNTPNFSAKDDYTVLFVDYMSHDTQKQALAVCGKDKIVQHHGSVSTAVDVIINLAKRLPN